MKRIVTAALISLSGLCFSQNKYIDSLNTLLNKSKIDTNRINLLIAISKEHIYNGEEKKGKVLADEAMLLSKQLNFVKGIAVCYQLYGIERSGNSDYDSAIGFFQQSISVLEKTTLRKRLGSVYGDLGNTYYQKGLLPQAIESFLKALKVNETLKDKKGIAGFSINTGVIYDKMGDWQRALTYYEKALKINEEIGSQQGIALAYSNIGIIYSNLGKEEQALEYYKKALQINESVGNSYYLWNAYDNICCSYKSLGDFENALKYAEKAVVIASKNDDVGQKIRTQQLLGNLYTKTGKSRRAEQLLLENEQLLMNVNSPDLKKKNGFYLSELYTVMGNYRKALDYYKIGDSMENVLFNDENKRKILEQQAQFEYEKKTAADSLKVVEEKKIVAAQLREEKTQRFALYGGLTLVAIFAGVMFNRFRITNKQKNIIEIKEKETQQQKHIIEEKHREITDSINYAERIQRSFLATKELLDANLQEYFVLFKPKDVVSGDFYWAASSRSLAISHPTSTFADQRNLFYICTADSTGHGVPGAIMSLLNITSIEGSIKEGFTEPSDILNETRKTIIERLKKDGSKEGGKDGMDCSLCMYDLAKMKLHIAAANNPVWIVRNGDVIEIKPDKMPVGKHDKQDIPFTQQEFDLQKGDVIYTLTDGFPDQFGGPGGKKFMSKKLRELLAAHAHLPMQDQKQFLEATFKSWVGDLEQVDDVTVIGIRV